MGKKSKHDENPEFSVEVRGDDPFDEPTSETIKIRVSPRYSAVDEAICRIEQISGPGQPRVEHLADRLVVGRGKDCDWQIELPVFSRRHLEYFVEGKEVFVRDCNSRNGVYLNGVRVHSAVLHSGDCVQVGDVRFVFQKVVG